jgi:hypothetical protein
MITLFGICDTSIPGSSGCKTSGADYNPRFPRVVVKTMEQPQTCKGCEQAHTCAKVHERLGKADGPSVILKAVVAFLLPIAVFAGVLVASGQILKGIVAPRYETPIAFVIALTVTAGVMLVVSTVLKRLHRSK